MSSNLPNKVKQLSTAGSVRSKSKPLTKKRTTTTTLSSSSTSTLSTSESTLKSTTLSSNPQSIPKPIDKVDDEGIRRINYRPVLANPLEIDWPTPSTIIRKRVLDLLLSSCSCSCSSLEEEQVGNVEGNNRKIGIGDWRIENHRSKRRNRPSSSSSSSFAFTEEVKGKKRKIRNSWIAEDGEKDQREVKKRKIEPRNEDSLMEIVEDEESVPKLDDRFPQQEQRPFSEDSTLTLNFKKRSFEFERPEVLDYLTIGINDLTRSLETRIRWNRWELNDPDAAPKLRFNPSDSVVGSLKGKEKEGKAKGKNRRKNRTLLGGRIDSPILIGPEMEERFKERVQEDYRFLFDSKTSRDRVGFLRSSGEDGPNRILANSLSLNVKKRKATSEVTKQSPSSLDKPRSTSRVMMKKEEATWYPLIDLIFVCKPDINPPSLVAHLPTMIAALNGSQRALFERNSKRDDNVIKEDTLDLGTCQRPMYLVPLDLGAEQKLADALGLRRVSVLGIDSSSSKFNELIRFVQEHFEPLFVPWLNPERRTTFIPTHIKHLKSTAPLNPKLAHQKKKEQKKKGKQEMKKLNKSGRKEVRTTSSVKGREGEGEGGNVYVVNDSDEEMMM